MWKAETELKETDSTCMQPNTVIAYLWQLEHLCSSHNLVIECTPPLLENVITCVLETLHTNGFHFENLVTVGISLMYSENKSDPRTEHYRSPERTTKSFTKLYARIASQPLNNYLPDWLPNEKLRQRPLRSLLRLSTHRFFLQSVYIYFSVLYYPL